LIGKVISGDVSQNVSIRLHSRARVNVGDILVIKEKDYTFFVKVINVTITSSEPQQFVEEIAGRELEHEQEYELHDAKERFYKLCQAKILKTVHGNKFLPGRTIPSHFSNVYKATPQDFAFLKDQGEITIGCLRLGAESIKEVNIALPAKKLISHHMLVVAATGKGKSNFTKVFVAGLMKLDNYSSIIMDPHGEYYGGKGIKGLSDHALKHKILLLTPRYEEYPGSEPLKIHAEDLEPGDFTGIVDLSVAQKEALDALHKFYGKDWLLNLLVERKVIEVFKDLEQKIAMGTLYALKRKINYYLELEGKEGVVFSLNKRNQVSVYEKIWNAINENKTIIIDTSLVGDEAERLISSSVLSRVFTSYRKIKQANPAGFKHLPELLLIFEEAPRVLGKDVLTTGTNIFERVAREGRKFKIGLCAITQMPSLIPREILSQMNTKVIMGLPAPVDREAVINSSSQNISDENTEIQMLDVGEAIITSPFIKFPLPVKVMKFEELLKQGEQKKDFTHAIGVG